MKKDKKRKKKRNGVECATWGDSMCPFCVVRFPFSLPLNFQIWWHTVERD